MISEQISSEISKGILSEASEEISLRISNGGISWNFEEFISDFLEKLHK